MWTIHIPSAPVALEGIWEAPRHAFGIVLFVNGSGDRLKDPGHQQVARMLQSHGLATVLIDLLPDGEARQSGGATFDDEDPLSRRLLDATRWCLDHACGGGLPLGYFGAGTGTAAALTAAARLGTEVGAVVSCEGRPDLVPAATLRRVTCPTLLVAGSADEEVLASNRWALSELRGEARLEIVAGASHFFEEPWALAQVAWHAASWLDRHLRRTDPVLVSAMTTAHARTV